MTQSGLHKVLYTHLDGTSPNKQKTVITLSDVQQYIKGIDVTGLSEQEQQEMLQLWNEYQQYREAAIERLFKFEDFVEHQYSKTVTPKWRTYAVENLKFVD